MEIYRSARKHGVSDDDIVHAVEHAVIAAEQDDGKVLYLGPITPEISSRSWPSPAKTAAKS